MATSKALLSRLRSLFLEDPFIDEVGLLFDTESRILTPESAFSLENHKLGVEFAAGIPLFQAARTQFHALNARLHQEASKISPSLDSEQRAQLLHCTRAILLISADSYTAWNTRKSFVARGWLDTHDEIQFTNLVFTLHPKSIDTWAYRRWLANRACQSLSEKELSVFYREQIEVCSRLAEQKPRNYHAWSFRHWIVSRLPIELTLQELNDMERWCRTHITDYSGWNHRQHILNELMKKYQVSGEVALSQKLIFAEYRFVSEIMAPYPTHEALWCHRRYIMQCLLNEHLRKNVGQDRASLHDTISWVAKEVASATPKSHEIATLNASWDEQLERFRSDPDALVLCAIVNEIGISWKCDNQFSRRFSAWCLGRLRVVLRKQQMVNKKALDARLLDSLELTFQKYLIQGDSILKELWLGAYGQCYGD